MKLRLPLACLLIALPLASLRAQESQSPADPFATLAALPIQPAVERGVRAVVRDAKGEPVPQAALVVIATADDRYSDAWTAAAKVFPGDSIRQGGHACTLVGGQRFALDDRGGTTLPSASGYVLAWHDGSFAAKSFQVNEGQPTPRVELLLAAPWTGVVEVVDATGRAAAGVPVGIANGTLASPRHATDASGRATLRQFAASITDKTTARLLIAANQILEAPAPATGGAVRLQLPACGRVRATFTGPLLPGSTLGWSLRQMDRSIQPTMTGEREATFAFVQIGYEGELQVTADSVTVKAPVRGVTAGNTTEIGTMRKEDGRYLVLRPLGPDGKPLRTVSVDTRWTYANGSSSSNATTNAEGWIELEVPQDKKAARLRLGVHAGNWSSPLVGAIEVEVGESDQGRIDKGEVKLAKPEVMLAGRVVDITGLPVSGIRLYASTEHSGYAQTDTDGRFEFAMPGSKPNDLTVRLMSSGWFFVDPVSTSRSFPTSEPARIVLAPAGRVRFAAPGLVKDVMHSFNAHVEPADGSNGRVDVSFAVARDFLMLPAGQWHYVVTTNNREVHRIENVRVDAGVEVHDPRFMAFDWKAFATLLVVHVEDANGNPTAACTIWRRQNGGSHGQRPSNGVLRWLVADDGASLHVEPHDKSLKAIDLDQATGEHWVRLGAGPRLAVQVEPAPKLPPNAQLVARVGARSEPLVLDATGSGFEWLDKTGDHTVQLGLRLGDTTHDLADSKRNVDVAVGGSKLVFPGGAPLQAAIDKLAPK
jgi:hypothetical protein